MCRTLPTHPADQADCSHRLNHVFIAIHFDVLTRCLRNLRKSVHLTFGDPNTAFIAA